MNRMETINYKLATTQLYGKLSKADFSQMPISEYNKEYLKRITPALLYYLDIYTRCFADGLGRCDKPVEELTFVDYGGGSGFLSMLAKQIGIGKVIYIDLNPKSVETITHLTDVAGIGPDVILLGDSADLVKWCKAENIQPELLVATDVIEHIYDLSAFFKDMADINDRMEMVFTTASTPYNPYVMRRLRRVMRGCETGKLERPNYYTKRVEYIRENFPQLGRSGAKRWAIRTRGLNYADIRMTITTNERPLLLDAYNTCDPETGNWVERILPLKEYKEIAARYDYKVYSGKGFYNTDRPAQWKTIASTLLNEVIKYSGKVGFLFSPFILLSFSRK